MTSNTDKAGFDPAGLAKAIKQVKGPAPVHLWDPPFCGDIDMRIAVDGTWYYQNSPIRRPAMVKLFSSVLRLDADGCYYLVTPVEKVRIQVDDCPFVAQLLEVEGSAKAGDQKLVFITNTDERIQADLEHPIVVDTLVERDEPHPRILCRTNLFALISRNVYYQLAELAQQQLIDGRQVIGVFSANEFFPLQ